MRIDSFLRAGAFLLVLVSAGCGSANKGVSARSPAKIPFGALDNPPVGATVKGLTKIDGWALFEEGVDHVAVYVDRIYIQDASVEGKRDDVIKVYPEFASIADMKFVTEFHAESLTPGQHEVSVRVIGRNGATRDLVPHTITVER